MARKTFISYKYSESKELRDKILDALGEDARYYKGETSESPDRTDQTTDTIKNALKNMIYQTSVLVVIASPDMNSSNWIEWEIKYALRSQKRGDTTSQPNGVVVVIKEENGSVEWFMNRVVGDDGCTFRRYNNHYFPEIIKANRFNRKYLNIVVNIALLIRVLKVLISLSRLKKSFWMILITILKILIIRAKIWTYLRLPNNNCLFDSKAPEEPYFLR